MSEDNNVTHPSVEPDDLGVTESHLIETRRQKAIALRASGVNPYPYRFTRTHAIAEALADFEELVSKNTEVRLAGRIMLKREMGKSVFCDLRDQGERIQAYAKINTIGEASFAGFADLDIGDIIGVSGTFFVTRTGERTLAITSWEILCKALHPLPEKHAGLVDIEMRYRQRYVDLIVNHEIRDVFVRRAKIVEAIREFFSQRDFLEVETPILQPLYGGAAARPFVTHHNALDTRLYLRIADELYLKRLIVGGFERVWEYCKDFRNEGMDRLHNPEFSMCECYWAYHDVFDMMNFTEDMFRFVVERACGKMQIPHEDREIDFGPPFRRITMLGGVKDATGLDLAELSYEQAREVAKGRGLNDLDKLGNWGKIVAAMFERFVEPTLFQPTFISDFPVEISPLAKRHRDNPRLTERFELFVAGYECANAFSELNDPDDQRDRFLDQVAQAKAGDTEAPNVYDADYVTALQYGMPPTAGLGFGVDRMVMILTNQRSIRDVLLFPQMRPLE